MATVDDTGQIRHEPARNVESFDKKPRVSIGLIVAILVLLAIIGYFMLAD